MNFKPTPAYRIATTEEGEHAMKDEHAPDAARRYTVVAIRGLPDRE
ncbi:MAG: hypothetical protein QM775_35800 [Pirellulales bacterium]